MKTDNIVILKNLHNYDDFESADFLVCSKTEVVEGYLHDTYNAYGIAVDEYAASDYCLANTESSMDSAILLAILQSQDFKPYLSILIKKEGFDPDNDKDVISWGESAINIDSDGTVEVNHEINSVLSAFARQYNEDNAIFTEATYVNYWDGHNFQTLLICAQSLDFDAFDILTEDDDEYNDIMQALKCFDTHISEGVSKSDEIGNYIISTSLYVDDHFITIERK